MTDPALNLNQNDSPENTGPLIDIKSRIAGLKRLPPMPEMAQRILKLSNNPNAAVKDLVTVVEIDPSLTAQVLRYASSPFFGYRGKVDSIHVAVSRVLGYTMVMNMALGVATAKSFKMPKNIPLGLDAFWRHAVYSAALVQALSNALPKESRPPAGLAYLAGLLHNFGHLLVGHLFRQEFLLLNKFITNNPDKSVVEIELEVLGVDHGRIGAWLMKAWRLPEEVIVATREHHNEHYYGDHAVYAQLVLLSDRLLKKHGIGEASSEEMPEFALEGLGLGEYQAKMIAKRVLDESVGLDSMVMHLSTGR